MKLIDSVAACRRRLEMVLDTTLPIINCVSASHHTTATLVRGNTARFLAVAVVQDRSWKIGCKVNKAGHVDFCLRAFICDPCISECIGDCNTIVKRLNRNAIPWIVEGKHGHWIPAIASSALVDGRFELTGSTVVKCDLDRLR